MNNLIRLLAKHHVLLLFILLELTALIIVFQGKDYHRAAFISSANSVSGNTYNVVNNFSEYLSLKEQNQILAEENARLRSQMLNSLEYVNGEYIVVNDSVFRQKYTYKVGKVIKNSIKENKNNFITINLGKNDGVMPEMGVISSNGVVGFVGAVSDNYSAIYSFLNKNTRVSVRVKRNRTSGTLIWEGEDPNFGTIRDIPITTEVNIGDSLITSGFSSIYPAGLYLGKVSEIEPNEDYQTHKLKIALSVDFNKISHVYVVNNLVKNEMDSLKNSLPVN